MNNKKNVFEMLNFEDEANIKHGLHGHVRVSIKNNETGFSNVKLLTQALRTMVIAPCSSTYKNGNLLCPSPVLKILALYF